MRSALRLWLAPVAPLASVAVGGALLVAAVIEPFESVPWSTVGPPVVAVQWLLAAAALVCGAWIAHRHHTGPIAAAIIAVLVGAAAGAASCLIDPRVHLYPAIGAGAATATLFAPLAAFSALFWSRARTARSGSILDQLLIPRLLLPAGVWLLTASALAAAFLPIGPLGRGPLLAAVEIGAILLAASVLAHALVLSHLRRCVRALPRMHVRPPRSYRQLPAGRVAVDDVGVGVGEWERSVELGDYRHIDRRTWILRGDATRALRSLIATTLLVSASVAATTTAIAFADMALVRGACASPWITEAPATEACDRLAPR